ncbi:ABC transporter ATP-binding protein [Mammaliicoccus lentus]|uniref:ABC transporter ATP-binding protein n=2 Tax=Mammaliicoccus lentus TaxID=42858 RepID=UPI0015F67E64|nr:ABC transporter ATP-binding protein [Mammaliicoccus lentus]HIS18252.1 ABC transporter ATP-binding protein [Candidatus Coprovivens excrementavium]MBW0770804.1 ABC transporter ATP-binding protein [Mammaliicoccus lentus]MCD2521445.1 ABC transporter ATP-binding protein [Mammaliicoccus lentus]MEB5686017.1 ABC transporter ATP-binding protein [Mammaliicoccus lentus]QMU10086.1 ABC transporter ATP-binding protein [Mammaliicoccus lentus]
MKRLIKLNHITKEYRNGKQSLNVLKGISLDINAGDFVSIVGKSGSGKSTLLNIIGLLDVDFSGEYLFEEKEINRTSDLKLSKFRNQKIGFIFQNFNLIDEYTVLENIYLPSLYSDTKINTEYIQYLIKKLNLEQQVNEYACNLSGGQKQRVAIIRALANKPSLIIADEPTGSLDEKNRNLILNTFRGIHEEGMTIILVTHDPTVAQLSNKKYIMKDGLLYSELGVCDENY